MLLVIVEERFIVAFQQMTADSLNLIEYVSALDGSQIFFHAKFNKPTNVWRLMEISLNMFISQKANSVLCLHYYT